MIEQPSNSCACRVEVESSLGQIWDSRIVYCPLHQAAPALLAACKATVPFCHGILCDGKRPDICAGCQGDIAIRQAEEKD